MTVQNPLTEKDFQQLVYDGLEMNGYIKRGNFEFDAKRAMDPGMLMAFIEDTQPETFEKLWNLFDGDIEEGIFNRVATDIGRRGLIRVLWDGVDFDGVATLISCIRSRLPYSTPMLSGSLKRMTSRLCRRFGTRKTSGLIS